MSLLSFQSSLLGRRHRRRQCHRRCHHRHYHRWSSSSVVSCRCHSPLLSSLPVKACRCCWSCRVVSCPSMPLCRVVVTVLCYHRRPSRRVVVVGRVVSCRCRWQCCCRRHHHLCYYSYTTASHYLFFLFFPSIYNNRNVQVLFKAPPRCQLFHGTQ